MRPFLAAVLLLLSSSSALSDASDVRKAEEGAFWNNDDIDWKTNGRLSHLFPVVGTYNIEPVFKDPYVNRALKQMLGNEYVHLLRNMQVRGPIDFISGDLFIVGSRMHIAHIESAIVLININWGEIIVAIHSRDKILLYTYDPTTGIRPGAFRYRWLPFDLRVWLGQMDTTPDGPPDPPDFRTPPSGLVWEVVAGNLPMPPPPQERPARPGR